MPNTDATAYPAVGSAAERDGRGVAELVRENDTVGVTLDVYDTVGVTLDVSDTVGETLRVTVALAVGVSVEEGDAPRDKEAVGVVLSERLCVGTCVAPAQ